MKKAVLTLGSFVCLGGLVGCKADGATMENNQFSVTCQKVDGCRFDYVNQGEVVDYILDYNETLYFNYPDESRIRITNYYINTKIYSTKEIVTNNHDDVKIIENAIIILN